MATLERPHTRADRAAAAAALRARGLGYLAIATELGISRSYAADLIADPSGERGRARKRSYRGVCERCGATTDGSNGPGRAPRFCFRCAPAVHRQKRWTQEAIVDAVRRFAAEHGRQPTSSEWMRSDRGDGYPALMTVHYTFGSWANAVEAAGFPRPRRGVRVTPAKVHTRACALCGQTFSSASGAALYCSKLCRGRARPERQRRVPVVRECRGCGASFTVSGRTSANRRFCLDCRPLGYLRRRREPKSRVCVECGAVFVQRHGGPRHRCYDCHPAGTRRQRFMPTPRACLECGATFTATGRGAPRRLRCYDCQPRGVIRQPRAAPKERTCVQCGQAFTTRPGLGQHLRQRCYDCLPTAPPGRSPSTLKRHRRALAA